MTTAEPYQDNYLKDVSPAKGYFDRFRVGNAPTLYDSILTAVTADVTLVGWIFAAVILAFAIFLIIPGDRRWQGRVSSGIRILIGVGFWVFIILCNFGQDWEVSDLKKVKTQYKALLSEEITADIGAHIGLRSVNITLLGKPRIQSFENGRMNETIDYNERFSFNSRGWVIGRSGFGPRASRLNQDFRTAQRRGLPYPILWIAEYFTPDGEGIRWGRYYLQAGYFTHIFVWSAWAVWMVTVILFNMVPRYGGYFSGLTGVLLIIANIIYGNLRNSNDLVIPFNYEGCTNESNAGDNRGCLMKFHFGWCFWLCLAVGICCILICVAVIIVDLLVPAKLAEFFNVDIMEDFEEYVVISQADEGLPGLEANNSNRFNSHKSMRHIQLGTVPSIMPDNSAGEAAVQGQLSAENQAIYQHGFRKRTTSGFQRFQKSQKTVSRQTHQTGSRMQARANGDDNSKNVIDNLAYENHVFSAVLEDEQPGVEIERENPLYDLPEANN